MQHPAQMVEYPDPSDERDCVIKFRACHKQHPVGFYLVWDFDSFLVPVDDTTDRYTHKTDQHEVSGFCCYRVTQYEQYQTAP